MLLKEANLYKGRMGGWKYLQRTLEHLKISTKNSRVMVYQLTLRLQIYFLLFGPFFTMDLKQVVNRSLQGQDPWIFRSTDRTAGLRTRSMPVEFIEKIGHQLGWWALYLSKFKFHTVEVLQDSLLPIIPRVPCIQLHEVSDESVTSMKFIWGSLLFTSKT